MKSNEHKVTTLFTSKIYFFSWLLLCFFMFYLFIYLFIYSCYIEGGTIKTLRNNLDCLEELTTLLDSETPGMKNWLHFACKLGVPKEDCDSLKPKGNASPTRTLMEHIVQVDPDLMVQRFIEALKKMQRTDVVNALRKLLLGNSYFHLLKLSCVGQGTFFRNVEGTELFPLFYLTPFLSYMCG